MRHLGKDSAVAESAQLGRRALRGTEDETGQKGRMIVQVSHSVVRCLGAGLARAP